MKILLDENIPIQLKRSFPKYHEWYTVRELEWQGTKNGQLLRLMISKGFEGLITMDKNLYKQQNILKLEIFVILINARDNKIETLKTVIGDIMKLLAVKLVGYFEVNA